MNSLQPLSMKYKIESCCTVKFQMKVRICDEFQKENSLIRILFATEAFGMEIDISDIRAIVHVGVPRTLES